MTNIVEKNYRIFLIKHCNILGLREGRPSYIGNLPIVRAHPTIQNTPFSSLFSDPDPVDQNQCEAVRIRIHKTAYLSNQHLMYKYEPNKVSFEHGINVDFYLRVRGLVRRLITPLRTGTLSGKFLQPYTGTEPTVLHIND
jgi:hypothetical protein